MDDWSKGQGKGKGKGGEGRAPHVHRIVNPLGAVVSGASSESPSPPGEGDQDSYIMSNEDEALFRPVVSAPRSLPASHTPPTRPLSSTLLLPVRHLSPPSESAPPIPPPASSQALGDRVVIPARLTHSSHSCHTDASDNHSATDVRSKSEVIVNQCHDQAVKAPQKDIVNKSVKKKTKDKKNEKNKASFQLEQTNTASLETTNKASFEPVSAKQASVEPESIKETSFEPVPTNKAPFEHDLTNRASVERDLTNRASVERNVTNRASAERDLTNRAHFELEQTYKAPFEPEPTNKAVIQPEQSSKKCFSDALKNVTSIDYSSIETPTPNLSPTYLDEISKAVDTIEVFNDEITVNNSTRISSYDWAKLSGSPPVSCDATLNTIIDEVCSDEIGNKMDVFGEISSQVSNVSETFVLPLKNPTKKAAKHKINLEKNKMNEESAWEMLSDVQHVQTQDLDALKFDINLTPEGFSIPEIKDIVSPDVNKLRKKKTKFSKPKVVLGLKDELADIPVDKDLLADEGTMDFIMPEEPPKLSWSAVASSKTRKSIENPLQAYIKGLDEAFDPRELSFDDNSLASKLSSVCKKKNIVVALCETPEAELCFVDEHHSLFLEPPPLEPLDLVLDEQKIQEMHDSLLDYSSGRPNYKITSSSGSSNKSDSLPIHDDEVEVMRNFEDFISVSSAFNLPDLKHLEEEDIGLDKIKSMDDKVLVVSMEKFSDEENTSPSSSQTESDDCSNMVTSEMYAQEGQCSVVADEPMVCSVPAAPSKSANKKKPKRKRR